MIKARLEDGYNKHARDGECRNSDRQDLHFEVPLPIRQASRVLIYDARRESIRGVLHSKAALRARLNGHPGAAYPPGSPPPALARLRGALAFAYRGCGGGWDRGLGQRIHREHESGRLDPARRVVWDYWDPTAIAQSEPHLEAEPKDCFDAFSSERSAACVGWHRFAEWESTRIARA